MEGKADFAKGLDASLVKEVAGVKLLSRKQVGTGMRGHARESKPQTHTG
jgi:hypothetical protein